MTSARQQIREIRRAGYLPGETAGWNCSDCEKSCGKGWWRKTNYEYDEWECYCRPCAYQAVQRQKERPKLYLWVWTEFSTNPNWFFGMAFAIAETEEHAKKLVEDQHGSQVEDWGPVKKLDVCNPIAFCISGSE